ncbi:hypothetical protein PQO03_07540 [Lentisphaera profundi]|uniref:DUF3997 domain-containing protein n=1 Tax=Lentisphaera profundi TaxID=1658616 RepID=A0ABY7VN98_9BACT|nr:hypothetical protein [Lentisphaera profundi]WDE95571.1 hypothetical protein PQO03_07540 [Lentisphaera profundi]
MNKILIIIITFSLLTGCGFVHDEHIIGPYRLIAVDISEQMSISYELEGGAAGRINETVFEYGFDAYFIVAKQHPKNNRNIINYFYLEMKKDSKYANPSDSVTGPLTKKEFGIATKKLNLPNFSHTIKHLK